jgi:hypothetical protein
MDLIVAAAAYVLGLAILFGMAMLASDRRQGHTRHHPKRL